MSIDLLAMWIGYCVMLGTGGLAAGILLALGMRSLFWSGRQESIEYLRYRKWAHFQRQENKAKEQA